MKYKIIIGLLRMERMQWQGPKPTLNRDKALYTFGYAGPWLYWTLAIVALGYWGLEPYDAAVMSHDRNKVAQVQGSDTRVHTQQEVKVTWQKPHHSRNASRK